MTRFALQCVYTTFRPLSKRKCSRAAGLPLIQNVSVIGIFPIICFYLHFFDFWASPVWTYFWASALRSRTIFLGVVDRLLSYTVHVSVERCDNGQSSMAECECYGMIQATVHNNNELETNRLTPAFMYSSNLDHRSKYSHTNSSTALWLAHLITLLPETVQTPSYLRSRRH